MHLLIIDDDPSMCDFFSDLLARYDCEMSTVADAATALRVIEQRGDVDVIFLDWGLPGLSGIEFLAQIKANPKLSAISVIMITGHSAMQDIMTALNAGASEYLMKPFIPEMVLEKLHMCGIDLKRASA